MKKYDSKVVISGKVIEVYSYDEPVFYDYADSKRVGRSVSASEEDKIINRQKTLNRASRDLRRIINCNIRKFSKFLTLTFAENVTDLDKANNEFKKFIKRLNYHYGIKLKYTAIVEFQKRGAIHYHVVLYNLTEKVDVNKIGDIWGNGFIKLNAIDNVDNVGAYVTKYMTKELADDRLIARRNYFNSRGLDRPQETKEPDVVNAVVSSLQNQAPKYENTFNNEYNSVVYKQYIIE